MRQAAAVSEKQAGDNQRNANEKSRTYCSVMVTTSALSMRAKSEIDSDLMCYSGEMKQRNTGNKNE